MFENICRCQNWSKNRPVFYINPLKQKRGILGHRGRGVAPFCVSLKVNFLFEIISKEEDVFLQLLNYTSYLLTATGGCTVSYLHLSLYARSDTDHPGHFPFAKRQHNNHNHHHNSLKAKASWAIWINRTSAMDHRFADPHAVNVEPKATSSGENLQNVERQLKSFFSSWPARVSQIFKTGSKRQREKQTHLTVLMSCKCMILLCVYCCVRISTESPEIHFSLPI